MGLKFWKHSFCFLLAYLFSITVADSLYDASDPIVELDIDTFDKEVYGQKRSFFVEFYSSWCGACIAYAPKFKQFSRQVQSWKPIVQVTVVNCAEEKNMPLCRTHEIHGFPTLKYFKYNPSSKNHATLFGGDKHNLATLSLELADFVRNDSLEQKPEGWPHFTVIADTTSLTDIWVTTQTKFLLLVAEEDPNKIGNALTINFHNDRHVRVAMIHPSHPTASAFGLTANKVALVQRGSSNPLWVSSDSTSWVSIQEKVNELVSGEPAGQAVEPVLSEPKQPALAAPLVPINLAQYQVQLVDLQSALSAMLLKEIVRRERIEGEDLEALKRWLHVLKKYAPGTTPIRRLLHRLDAWAQAQLNVITADSWTTKLKDINVDLGNPIPATETWIACKGTKTYLRGYTCGLWTLAHAITVQAYNHEKDNLNFSPVQDVLEPWHQFIFRFLSCSECAQNFDKEASKHGLAYVTRKEDVVMWLVKVHNSVNKRLSGAPSEDPSFPKRQFPPKALCAHCWKTDDELDESETLKFVLTYYADIRTDLKESAPAYQMSQFQNGKLEQVANRHLNPKFSVNANNVDALEAEDTRNKKLDRNPGREWRSLDASYSRFDATQQKRTGFYAILLSVVGLMVFIAYFKYRRNKSRFWKQFYYSSDFKLGPKQNIA